MNRFMLSLLAKSTTPVSSIIDFREVSCRDLTVSELRFVQGNAYFAAKAYNTLTWIADTPMGPKVSALGDIQMTNINDVARVDVYSSMQELRARRYPREEELMALQEGLDASAWDLVVNSYPFLKEVLYKATFIYTPYPSILVCLATPGRFRQLLGTLSISVTGNVQITSKTSEEIERYAQQMQGVGCLPVAKELGYA